MKQIDKLKLLKSQLCIFMNILFFCIYNLTFCNADLNRLEAYEQVDENKSKKKSLKQPTNA